MNFKPKNSHGTGYLYIAPILDIDVKKMFTGTQITFSSDRDQYAMLMLSKEDKDNLISMLQD